MHCIGVDIIEITRIQEAVDSGLYISYEAAALAGISGNVLTRALGINSQVDVDVETVDVRVNDIFLFCTDGLYNMLTHPELEQHIRDFRDDLEDLADNLLEQACFKGGEDNVSFALIRKI